MDVEINALNVSLGHPLGDATRIPQRGYWVRSRISDEWRYSAKLNDLEIYIKRGNETLHT